MGTRRVIREATASFNGRINIIYGLPGSGKTTLLEGIAGVGELDSGSINLSARLLFLMQVPERSFIYSKCLTEITEGKNISESDWEVFNKLGISGDMLDMSPWNLSKGEKKRISLATILKKARESAKKKVVVILDDPFRDLDIKGKVSFLKLLFMNDNFDKIIMATANERDMKLLKEADLDYACYRIKKGRLISV